MHGSSCTQDHEEFFISPSWYCSEFQSLLVYSRKVLGAQRGPWSCAKRHPCQVQNVSFTTQASVVQTEISIEPGFQDETPTQIHPLMAPSRKTRQPIVAQTLEEPQQPNTHAELEEKLQLLENNPKLE